MSKASEWAKACAEIATKECAPFVCSAIAHGGDATMQVHADVGHRGYAPVVSITDTRLGGIHLDGSDAVALARWILDTFEDAPRA